MKKALSFLGSLFLVLSAEGAVQLEATFERHLSSFHFAWKQKGVLKQMTVPDAYEGKKVMFFSSGTAPSKIQSGTMMTKVQAIAPVVRLTFQAKGKGEIRGGLSPAYFTRKGKHSYKVFYAEKGTVLTDQWQKIEFTHRFTDSSPRGVTVMISLTGQSSVMIDKLLMETIADPAVRISCSRKDLILAEGSEFPKVRFDVEPANTALRGFVLYPDTSFETRMLGADHRHAFGVFDGSGLYRVAAAAEGASAEYRISLLPKEEYDICDACSRKIRFREKKRILFLGDSCYDFQRGRNAVDKLSWWLNKYYPGQAEIVNAAKAGDYITRIEERLKAKNGCYKGIFGKPYQIVFVAVGANDNRSLVKDGKWTAPFVPFADQTAGTKRVIALLRKYSPGARIIFVSSTASNQKLSDRKQASAARGKRPFVRFGIPELTRRGIAAQIAATAASDVEYINFYDEMTRVVDDSFFARYDVIHPDEKGHNFVTRKILEYLASQGRF